jgi:glycosyltransferase involved in cell wall biosynthesis
MKLLVLSTTYPRSSSDYIATFLHNEKRELAKKYDITVVAADGRDCQKSHTLDGVKVRRFTYLYPRRLQQLAYTGGILESFRTSFFSKLQAPLFMLSFFAKGVRYAPKADAIEANWLISGFVGVLLKKMFGKPLVFRPFGGGIRTFPRWLSNWVLNNSDAVITCTGELEGLVRKAGYRRKTYDIKVSVDFRRFKNRNEDGIRKEFDIKKNDFVITYVGRLEPMKDPLTFVKAIAAFQKKSRKKVKVFVVGFGHLAEEAKELALKLRAQIFFTGARGDVYRFLSVTDVFCAVSNLENCFSTTIIEAMHYGVPCLVTDAGETTKYFTHKKHAYITKKENPDDIARGLLELVGDAKLRARLSEGGKEFLDRLGFSQKEIVAKNIKLYESLVK